MMLLMVAIGGAIGSVLRYLISNWCIYLLGSDFPLGTLIVNVIGSFFIGLMFSLFESHTLISSYWRPFISVGLIGGFTTFSTFSLETLSLIIQAEYYKACFNVILNLSLGLLAVSIGYFIFKH
ncbi:MAG: fluoride efflux transporter CrcB [Candidatus Schmidhempelia sp.]|nr:fluoride efflux transporter CrcB [Candidatus Schmidhempelia sp.]